MKKGYIIIGGVFAFLGLVICLENIMMSATVLVLVKYYSGSLFLPLLVTLVMGILAGLFWGMATKESRPNNDF